MTDAKKTPVPSSPHSPPTLPDNATDRAQSIAVCEEIVPRWKQVWRHSLTQMMLLSVQAFCGPAMSDAITGLGGGGLATPQVSNISNAIRYAMLAIFCFFGGPIVNKIGVKWALVIGSMSFPIQGSAYYCNSKFGNQWYLILSGAIGGIGTACWYVAEAGAIMTLAPSGARGKYLALWIVSRNLGQLVGGAINLAKNHEKGVSGGVTPDTFVAFVIIECIALPFALLITPFERVIRSDGTKIVTSETLSTKREIKYIAKTVTSRLIVLSALWALWSFFYTGTWSTYLGIYFSVRARALSSLISPFFCIIGCFGLGYILDMRGLNQRRRAQIGLYTVVILNVGVYIWSIIMQTKFNRNDPGHIDWDDRLYASSFLPYFFIQTTGPLSQSYMYWLLSSFATDAQENVRNGAAFRCIEAVGQAVAYGMNSQTTSSPLVGFCVTFALLGASLLPMIMLVNTTPDRIPADVIAEQQNVAHEKLEGV
ncbi:major facilitator superfamily domain-containing protein [Aspergillus alliaceus]|uniref:major facilitator superfamily domain-containing protein n=1 Tax=Petromyces alliaceus TaxID=209559 RepID=UPI0012A5ABCA|nr:major facilitator superfamily domain-containing protein [Aspergillus alliaceus]KAB8230422.1 major facilitator superfamily domain-containing protein [Aspergillus alliaceus]